MLENDEENKVLIPPDYSEDDLLDAYPMEDDDEDYDPEKQETLYKKEMGSNSLWPRSSGGGSETKLPWMKEDSKSSGSSYDWSSWRQSSQKETTQEREVIMPPEQVERIARPKKILVLDVFDGLVESLDSDGKPGKIPRATYDIKLKIDDVWAALKSFSPEQIFGIFPANVLPNSQGWDITLNYIMSSLSSYLQIPDYSCTIVKNMTPGSGKDLILNRIAESVPDRRDILYIGVNSGYYGLGNADLIAAKRAKIEYADIYQVITGKV